MKENKGITLIVLIITIIVLLIIAGISINMGITGIEESNDNKLITELEKVQHAITERYTKYKLTKDTSLLVGTKVDDLPTLPTPAGATEATKWKVFQATTGVTVSTHPERKYYRLSKSDLENLGLTGDYKNSSYIVNYYSGEVYDEVQKQTSSGTVLYKTAIENEASELGDEVIQDGLQVWYDGINNTGSGHSNTTTTWKDLSGNGRDGKMKNVTIGSNYAQFNGTSSWTNLGEINEYTNEITMEAMIEIPQIKDNCSNIICNMEAGGLCLRLYYGKLEAYYYITGLGYIGGQTNKYLPLNSKNNVVSIYDGSAIKLYINGEKIEDMVYINANRNVISKSNFSGKNIKKTNINTVMALGTNPSGTYAADEFFNGKIYSAKIYNEALTDAEVKHNYIVDKARFGIEE